MVYHITRKSASPRYIAKTTQSARWPCFFLPSMNVDVLLGLQLIMLIYRNRDSAICMRLHGNVQLIRCTVATFPANYDLSHSWAVKNLIPVVLRYQPITDCMPSLVSFHPKDHIAVKPNCGQWRMFENRECSYRQIP